MGCLEPKFKPRYPKRKPSAPQRCNGVARDSAPTFEALTTPAVARLPSPPAIGRSPGPVHTVYKRCPADDVVLFQVWHASPCGARTAGGLSRALSTPGVPVAP